ncbi:hypothetical protein [Paraburkholderia silvatlantica]|uniref:hypothetical protein n=1 Tax=Paraburkholderia silvatlantica TaxID=321895 RepID=UPI003751F679
MENRLNVETRFRLLQPPASIPYWVATLATTTALCLSVLAGWQRGGTLPERVVWISTGIVLVICAHLLPALIRGSPVAIRLAGTLLWGACMVTTCYGHVIFFVFAQQHAGDARVSAAASGIADIVARPPRTLAAVMEERATVTHQLALAQARRCARDCTGLEVRRTTLAAKLDALNAEADDIRRNEAERDRAATRRDALRTDPVTSRLAAILGVSRARIDLLSGLAFAAVLEGVACLLWTVALRSPPSSPASPATAVVPTAGEVAPPAVTPGHARETVSRETGTGSHVPPDADMAALPRTGLADDAVMQLARDIAAGRVRPTVADIRVHLGCSQARALALRRQLTALTPTA